MRFIHGVGIVLISFLFICLQNESLSYFDMVNENMITLKTELISFQSDLYKYKVLDEKSKLEIINRIYKTRESLKKVDPWLRYFEPIEYKKIHGVLPVEWEVEAFEKFEIPYRRNGYGLLLMEEYLTEKNPNLDSLKFLLLHSLSAIERYQADSLQQEIKNPKNVLLVNRLFLLNLASIYTTGFECPNTENIVKELEVMIKEMRIILISYHNEFHLLDNYFFQKLDSSIAFIERTKNWNDFNHFLFIRDFVEPLFQINQKYIQDQNYSSIAYNEFSLNNHAVSLFDKYLYSAQDLKGVFKPIQNVETLNEIKLLGKKLFYDPLLSGNNKRSCASCHIPSQFFTDTTKSSSEKYDHVNLLERNTPTMVNFTQNQLIRMDGRHFNFFNQTRDVLSNPEELATTEKVVLKKILSCGEYKLAFKKILPLSTESRLSFKHISSAISIYLDQFNYSYSNFDSLIMNYKVENSEIVRGFNLFMGKAQCGTCHFVPSFTGVKAPFISNEFEVIGVPEDTSFIEISKDLGRYNHFKSDESLHSFRTSGIRNIQRTKPYMHNGVFNTLAQVLDFYNQGGGIGKGIDVQNQTLPADKLNLTAIEITSIISFMNALSENVILDYTIPQLPHSKNKKLNLRVSGGAY